MIQRTAIFFILVVTSTAALAAAQTNTIKSVRTVVGGVEIELHSTKEFPVRDELVILQIGAVECATCSRSPDDGSADTLIFLLTSEQFARTANGDRVTVSYGRDSTELWDFGPLDKSLLNRR